MCAGSIPLPSHTLGLLMWYFAKDNASCVIIEPNKDSLLHVALRYKGTKIREFKVIDGIFIFSPPPSLYISNIMKHNTRNSPTGQNTTRPLWCVDSKSEFYCFDYIKFEKHTPKQQRKYYRNLRSSHICKWKAFNYFSEYRSCQM